MQSANTPTHSAPTDAALPTPTYPPVTHHSGPGHLSSGRSLALTLTLTLTRALGDSSSTRSRPTTRCACSWRRGSQRTRRPAPPCPPPCHGMTGATVSRTDFVRGPTSQAVAPRIREHRSLCTAVAASTMDRTTNCLPAGARCHPLKMLDSAVIAREMWGETNVVCGSSCCVYFTLCAVCDTLVAVSAV